MEAADPKDDAAPVPLVKNPVGACCLLRGMCKCWSGGSRHEKKEEKAERWPLVERDAAVHKDPLPLTLGLGLAMVQSVFLALCSGSVLNLGKPGRSTANRITPHGSRQCHCVLESL